MATKFMVTLDGPVESQPNNALLQFLERIHPRSCLSSSCLKPSPLEEEEEDISIQRLPYLVKNLTVSEHLGQQSSERRLHALKTLYAFTGKKDLRVPIVCTTRWDICSSLAQCLGHNTTISPNSGHDDADEIRRLACLTLNNLSIPFENKAVMALGPGSKMLLKMLVLLIRLRVPEAYLCCICLMNLSYLDDALDVFANYSPITAANPTVFRSSTSSTSSIDLHTVHLRLTSSQKTKSAIQQAFPSSRNPSPARQCSIHSMTPALDDPNSLLRVLEKLLQAYRPFLMSTVLSIEGEAVRWAIALLRNLTRKESSVLLISRTDIPPLLVAILRHNPHPVQSWDKDSLEDHCLALLENLVSCESGILALRSCNAMEALERVVGEGGIYDYRATLVMESLGEPQYI